MKYFFVNAAGINWEKSQLSLLRSMGDVTTRTSMRSLKDLISILVCFFGYKSKDIIVFAPPFYTEEGNALLEELIPKGVTILSQAGWFDPDEGAWVTLPSREPPAGAPVKWWFFLQRKNHKEVEFRRVDFIRHGIEG